MNRRSIYRTDSNGALSVSRRLQTGPCAGAHEDHSAPQSGFIKDFKNNNNMSALELCSLTLLGAESICVSLQAHTSSNFKYEGIIKIINKSTQCHVISEQFKTNKNRGTIQTS